VIDRLDPRVRLVAALAASFMPLFLASWRGLGVAFAAAIIVALYARVPMATWTPRIVAVNLFVLTMAAIVPWSIPGDPLVIAGELEYSREGAAWAGRIALRANTVLLILTAFLVKMEPMTAGHALQRLRLPNRLVLLLMFTVRYIEVFEREYMRLRQAMRVRGFQPRLNRHTLRTFGHLVGMLLVHAFDRSERIQQAMKCRGFAGKFHTHRHMKARRSDWAFAAGLVLVLVAVGAAEWV
jgi:cobalt/nickel transport system permease protein